MSSINGILTRFSQQELVLAYSARERDRIKGSLSHLEKILGDALRDKVKRFIRFGSFTRNTILPRKYDPNSDVDLMIVMNTEDYRELSPGTYRKRLIDILAKSYPRSISKKDFPCVKLELNHIKFDIVPAVTENHRRYGERYFIPDSGDGWLETEPNDVNEALKRANTDYGSNIVRNVIRLMKYWNAQKGYPFNSYEMERGIIGLNFYEEDTYSGFLYALEHIAYDVANTKQALHRIDQYSEIDDVEKEYEWVQRLIRIA